MAISAIATAAGLSLDVKDVLGLESRWWALVAFIIFLVLVIWLIVELYIKNTNLESKKPSMTVTPECTLDLWYLDVFNNGETGVFTAQLCIVDEEEKLDSKYTSTGSRYDALWARTNTNKTEIMYGLKDTIMLATIQYAKEQYLLIKAYDVATKSPYNIRRIE